MTTGQTVLVVDDELGYRQLLQMNMSRQGFRVLTAGDGVEALALLETEKVDLVVTDMKMPRMDGLMTVMEIRKKFPATPIILMTGYAMEETLQKALAFKPTASLRKPFNMADLARVVHDVMPA